MTLHYTDPSLVGSASIRMVELELRNGLSPLAAIAFAFFGETLAAIGLYDKACRMGTCPHVLCEPLLHCLLTFDLFDPRQCGAEIAE